MRHSDLIKIFCKAFGLYFAIQAIINIKDTIFYGVATKFYGDDKTAAILILFPKTFVWGNFLRAAGIFNDYLSSPFRQRLKRCEEGKITRLDIGKGN